MDTTNDNTQGLAEYCTEKTRPLTASPTAKLGLEVSDIDIKALWERNADKRSRNGTMMLFDDFRMSLGGGDSEWGTKVFYKTCVDLGILRKCAGKKSYCPTDKVVAKYVNLFKFDEETIQWGIASGEIDRWNDEILPHIVTHAKKVREQVALAKKIKAKARYHETKNLTKELF